MTWVRIDDAYPDHPKMISAGPAAAWLDIRAICYSSRHLTDGFIPFSWVKKEEKKLADRLVSVGRWSVDTDGYRIKDYLDYNPSRSQVLENRTRRHEAAIIGGRARAGTGDRTSGKFTSDPPATSPADDQRNRWPVAGSSAGTPHQRSHQRKTSPRTPSPSPEDGERAPLRAAPAHPPWSAEAGEDWRPLGEPDFGKIGKALKRLVDRLGWDAVRPVWRRYIAEENPTYASPAGFASKFEIWRNGGASRSGTASPPRDESPEAMRNRILREEGIRVPRPGERT